MEEPSWTRKLAPNRTIAEEAKAILHELNAVMAVGPRWQLDTFLGGTARLCAIQKALRARLNDKEGAAGGAGGIAGEGFGGRKAEYYEGGESSRDDMGMWGTKGYGSTSGAAASYGDDQTGGREEAGGGAMEEPGFAGVMKKKLGRRASQPPTIFGSALAAAAAVDSGDLNGFRDHQGGPAGSEGFGLGRLRLGLGLGFGRLRPGSEGEVMKVLGDVDMLIERCMEMLIEEFKDSLVKHCKAFEVPMAKGVLDLSVRSASPLHRSVSAGDDALGTGAAAAAVAVAAADSGGMSSGHSISNSRYSKSLSSIDDEEESYSAAAAPTASAAASNNARASHNYNSNSSPTTSSSSGGGTSRAVNPMYSAQYSALVKRFKKLSSRPPITLDPFGKLAATAAAAAAAAAEEEAASAEEAAFAGEMGEKSGGNVERVGEGGRGWRGGRGRGDAASRTGSKGKAAGSGMEGEMREEEASVHKRTMSDDLFARDPLHAAFGVCHRSPQVSPNSNPSAVAAGRDGTAGGGEGSAEGMGGVAAAAMAAAGKYRFNTPHVEIPSIPELISPKQTNPHPLFVELEAVEVEDTFAAESHARMGANASGNHNTCAQNEAATNGDEEEDGGGSSNFTFSPLSDTSGSGSSASVSRSSRAAAEDIPNLLPSPVQMSGPASIVSGVSAIHARKNRSSQLARAESDAAAAVERAQRFSRREREQQKKQQERNRQQVQEEEDLYPLPDLPSQAWQSRATRHGRSQSAAANFTVVPRRSTRGGLSVEAGTNVTVTGDASGGAGAGGLRAGTGGAEPLPLLGGARARKGESGPLARPRGIGGGGLGGAVGRSERGGGMEEDGQQQLVPWLPVKAVPTLERIAQQLAEGSKAKECMVEYCTLRAAALEAAIAALEMGEVRAPALSALPWSSQEAFLKAWVRDAYLLMDVLLVAERFLCDSVFLFSHNLSTRSFRRVVRRATALKQALHLLCGNAAAICSSDEQPEKLFSLLDMIQTTQDLGSQVSE
ncbi:unnamed protein product [Closterium sp. NIES-54]